MSTQSSPTFTVTSNRSSARSAWSNADDELLCLGDMVGYGPNPNECVRLLRDRTTHAVLGNHDLAALENFGTEYFNEAARAAIAWTQKRARR